jgi:hypothetical protein
MVSRYNGVQVSDKDVTLSTWHLSMQQFGRTWELIWQAKNMAPVKCACLPCLPTCGTCILPLTLPICKPFLNESADF